MRISCLYGFVAAALAAVTVNVSAQTAARVDSTKLTTVLRTLASAVPQDDARAVAQNRPSTARITRDALPKAVQDAMATRRLRMNDANEVQVYILMSAVNDERLEQLRAGGATIEIPDAARRRVQARVPATRLQSIAALPFVDFIRLPAYARHLSGLTTTEGDRILRADVARQQASLDGTGVRVGVVSDGLKGVFASGCTSCNGLSEGPIATGDLPDSVGVRNVTVCWCRRPAALPADRFSRMAISRDCHPRFRCVDSMAPAPKGRRCLKSSTTSRRARDCRSRTSIPTSRSCRR
jgi:hypothetical protein